MAVMINFSVAFLCYVMQSVRRVGRHPMDRREIILAALAAGGENMSYSPVQVQKIFFLLDREVAPSIDGPHFDFQPYDYGPFDRAIYDQLEILQFSGDVEIRRTGSYRVYALTSQGFDAGTALLSRLDGAVSDFVRSVTQWVQSLSFQQLVAAIYQKYPEMKANSVFRE